MTIESKRQKHVRRRSKERLGLPMSRKAEKMLVEKIKTKQFKFIGNGALGRKLYEASWLNLKIVLVYDPKRERLATVYEAK